MRLIFVLAFFLSCMQYGFSKPANTPVAVEGQTINFRGNKVIRYSRIISNNTSSPIAFSFNSMPQNDSEFIAKYLLLQVTNPQDTEASKLEIIKALVGYFKSPYFTNHNILFTATDTVGLEKQCSVIGMVNSDFSLECGNYVREVQTIAFKTGYFLESDFETVNLTVHIVGQVMIYGYYCLFDPDPTTNGGMFPYAGSPNGYARMKDIRNDSTLIVPYLYQGQPLPGLYMSLSDYRSLMINSSLNYEEPNIVTKPLAIDGEFKIPARGSITADAPAVFYFVDTADDYTRNELMTVTTMLNQNSGLSNTAKRDSFIDVMKIIFNTDSATVAGLIDTSGSGISILYNSNNDQGIKISTLLNSTDYSDDSIPNWVFSFMADSAIIGLDIKAPLLVLNTSNSCNFVDTSITGPGAFILWNMAEAPQCDSNQVNYLQHGTLYGPGSVKCAVNIGLIDPLADWVINGDSAKNLVIEDKVTVLASGGTTTGIKTVTSDGLFNVYPNPAVNQVVVPYACRLFNGAGQMVMSLNEGCNAINLAGGTYIITDGINTKPLVIQ